MNVPVIPTAQGYVQQPPQTQPTFHNVQRQYERNRPDTHTVHTRASNLVSEQNTDINNSQAHIDISNSRGPPGVLGIWGDGLFIFRELGSTANYSRGAGEQAHTFGDFGSTAKK